MRGEERRGDIRMYKYKKRESYCYVWFVVVVVVCLLIAWLGLALPPHEVLKN